MYNNVPFFSITADMCFFRVGIFILRDIFLLKIFGDYIFLVAGGLGLI